MNHSRLLHGMKTFFISLCIKCDGVLVLWTHLFENHVFQSECGFTSFTNDMDPARFQISDLPLLPTATSAAAPVASALLCVRNVQKNLRGAQLESSRVSVRSVTVMLPPPSKGLRVESKAGDLTG